MIVAFPMAALATLVPADDHDDYAEPPPNRGSSLAGTKRGVKDSKFAELMSDLLGTNGAESAVFLFQQCFGGDMLDDLRDALGPIGVKWIGASASSWIQPSFGQDSPKEYDRKKADAANEHSPTAEKSKKVVEQVEGDPTLKDTYVSDNPKGYWTKELLSELEKDKTVKSAAEDAETKDKSGDAATEAAKKLASLFSKHTAETGQILFGNGGDTIKLNGATATSHHAFVWLDNPDRQRHKNNAKAFIDLLISQWGTSDKTSITVFGNGVGKDFKDYAKSKGVELRPASLSSLQTEVTKLKGKMNANEQFLFYGTGHSGRYRSSANATQLPGHGATLFPLDLLPEELEGLATTADNQPSVTVSITDLFDTQIPIEWYIDDAFMGLIEGFQSGVGTVSIDLDEQLLGEGTEIRFVNPNSSGVNLEEIEFYTGNISDVMPSVPNPPTILLIGMGLFTLLFFLRCNPSPARPDRVGCNPSGAPPSAVIVSPSYTAVTMAR